LNVYVVNNVRQTERQAAEPLVSGPSPLEADIAIKNRKKYELRGIYQISAELIEAGCNTLHSEFHKLINFIWNKEKLPQEWKDLIILPIHKKDDKSDCSNYGGISMLQLRTELYRIFFSQV
jgi:hypothetical protein